MNTPNTAPAPETRQADVARDRRIARRLRTTGTTVQVLLMLLAGAALMVVAGDLFALELQVPTALPSTGVLAVIGVVMLAGGSLVYGVLHAVARRIEVRNWTQSPPSGDSAPR